MLKYMLIRHKVKDFAVWKRAYDAHLSKRIEAGITEKNLFRSESDPNEVIMLAEVKDVVRAKKFTESVELRETMEKAGVIDKPDIFFLHDESSVFAKASGY
jgi:hypothetical protein